MEQVSGKLFQRSISKVLPNKLTADILEVIFLLLIGMLAITIHSKLRIPMGIPGKHGIIFMFLMITGKMASRFSFAASISSLGASALLYFNVLGFTDPFLPAIYLFIGFSLDLMFLVHGKGEKSAVLIAFFCGLSYMFIPLMRLFINTITHIPYLSLLGNMFATFMMHIVFGFIGGLLGVKLVQAANKKIS